jgi:hypothetical protein
MTFTTDTRDLYFIAAQEDRCTPRIALHIPASLRPSGTTGFKVDVLDLSLAGFSCSAVTSMRPGALCWLTLPGLGGLQSEVIWNNGSVVGCSFASLLNPAVLNSIIQRYT